MRAVQTHRAAFRWARVTGRAMIVIGLVLALAAFKEGMDAALGGQATIARVVFEAGLLVATAGCVAQAVILALWHAPRPKAGWDVALGTVSLLLGVPIAVWSEGDEGGPRVWSLLAIGLLMVVGGLALIMACTVSKRFGERWRNTGDG